MGVRDLLDVYAAFGRDHERHARAVPIDESREIKLTIDRRAFLDVDAMPLFPARPGLVGDEHRPEEPLGLATDLLDRAHHFDPAGLAAAARMDLCLDDHYRG